MKKNKILYRFLHVLLVTGGAFFASKTDAKAISGKETDKTINDRINLIRENIRTNHTGVNNSDMDHNLMTDASSPIEQVWINIVPSWHDWNKLWNDWANWNNWSKWNDWNNFHRDHDRDHHDRDRDKGHDKDRDRDHEKHR